MNQDNSDTHQPMNDKQNMVYPYNEILFSN